MKRDIALGDITPLHRRLNQELVQKSTVMSLFYISSFVIVSALVTTFLHVHPFGANIDYIWSYLHRLDVKIRSSELEDLLEKYPSVFGHNELERSAEKKWKFVGYEGVL